MTDEQVRADIREMVDIIDALIPLLKRVERLCEGQYQPAQDDAAQDGAGSAA